jgi:hypothetical protein
MPVSKESTLSRLERRMVKGVMAYAKAPRRLDQPPRPVRVEKTLVSSTGVSQTLYTIPTKLEEGQRSGISWI